MSLNIIAAHGPGPIPASSIIRNPLRGPEAGCGGVAVNCPPVTVRAQQ
jgi:hypothetical protein